MKDSRISVGYLARVEGEGGLDVVVSGGQITDLRLRVFEPPRFFEGFLVGRSYQEVPDFVSRICGICPVSHQLTSILALEAALGVEVPPEVTALRKLFALSQYIQSHALHAYLLAAPDFLGYPSVIELAQDHPALAARALSLKRVGNDLTALIGGREVHPVGAVVGGFPRAPTPRALLAIKERLEQARGEALETVGAIAGIKPPEFSRPTEFVALTQPDQYAVNGGRAVSNRGLEMTAAEYKKKITQTQVPHSNAYHYTVAGRESFMVGPLARVNLNARSLMPAAQEALSRCGVAFPSDNPFTSIHARVIELVHSVEECISLIDRLAPALPRRGGPLLAEVKVKAGEGAAFTEAPRGLLYHSYTLNSRGLVERADIVTPTAHNLRRMEDDLWQFVPRVIDRPLEEATLACEMVVRNYDPCISCATHFLRLDVRRVG
ncbi:MAG: Ni/Fe hydrogenase subunit alpha [Acetobacteraceae bacterium]|nr:Ni/Fe hydrogenase subunit alpha [Acetobacteraceae bacterium]